MTREALPSKNVRETSCTRFLVRKRDPINSALFFTRYCLCTLLFFFLHFFYTICLRPHVFWTFFSKNLRRALNFLASRLVEIIITFTLNFLASRLVEIVITFNLENCTNIRANLIIYANCCSHCYCKFEWNPFPNNERMKDPADQNLNEVVYILNSFHIAASWSNLLNG